ncbi:hypothetical protein [Lentibacillus jeotgali]|uniref:hypothetical protein n=1 Tax=Lentibacillus jeotgali TaxID=558169 RepID=UPI0002628067|nr:hypothetical protein [Lentibacillus jeotgali]
MKENRISFDELFRQNERRFQYYQRNLSIDPLPSEGLVVIWWPYRQYHPDLGLLATYFIYFIRKRLI